MSKYILSSKIFDKFAKLRQDDFDRTRTRDRDFAIPARQGGLRDFINRFARPSPPGTGSGDTTADTEFDVADPNSKPSNLKETLQRDLYILKRIPYGEILKESILQSSNSSIKNNIGVIVSGKNQDISGNSDNTILNFDNELNNIERYRDISDG